MTGRVADFAPNAKTIIHIDIDPSSISKNIKVDVPIVGDIKTVLRSMLKKVKSQESLAPRQRIWAEWYRQIMDWKAEKPLPYEKHSPDGTIKPRQLIDGLAELTRGEGGDCHRRGPAPDVDGPDDAVQASALVAHLRRPGHHGLRLAGRHWGAFCRARA